MPADPTSAGAILKVSIIIPCYNEAATIGAVIKRVGALEIDKQIVVIDDGSTDGTRNLLEGDCAQSIDHLVVHAENQGKGAALQSGFARATGDVVLVQDADLEYDCSDYPSLLQPIEDDLADVVYGSRFIGGRPHRVLYFWHRVGNGFLTFCSNVFTNLNLTDMECGYKVFRKSVLDQIDLSEKRFGFEPEVTAKVARLNIRIYEVGISYAGRTYAEGKKIGWQDGVRALYVIIKYSPAFSWLTRR